MVSSRAEGVHWRFVRLGRGSSRSIVDGWIVRVEDGIQNSMSFVSEDPFPGRIGEPASEDVASSCFSRDAFLARDTWGYGGEEVLRLDDEGRLETEGVERLAGDEGRESDVDWCLVGEPRVGESGMERAGSKPRDGVGV